MLSLKCLQENVYDKHELVDTVLVQEKDAQDVGELHLAEEILSGIDNVQLADFQPQCASVRTIESKLDFETPLKMAGPQISLVYVNNISGS